MPLTVNEIVAATRARHRELVRSKIAEQGTNMGACEAITLGLAELAAREQEEREATAATKARDHFRAGFRLLFAPTRARLSYWRDDMRYQLLHRWPAKIRYWRFWLGCWIAGGDIR